MFLNGAIVTADINRDAHTQRKTHRDGHTQRDSQRKDRTHEREQEQEEDGVTMNDKVGLWLWW